jgi:5'(3')-deoxyribonucleotidase
MTFGIDIDECLRHIIGWMVLLYNKEFHQEMTEDDVKDYDVDKSFPLIRKETGMSASEWFFQKHGHELFRLSGPIGDASSYISRLRKIGRVIIISDQKSYENKADTLWWLMHNGIEYDGVCFVDDKSLVKVDYLCDDNPAYLMECGTDHAVLISSPHNMDVNIDDILECSGSKDIIRVRNLEEFVKYIETTNSIHSWQKKPISSTKS